MNALEQRQLEFSGYLIAGFPNLGIPGIPAVSAAAVTGNATQENNVLPTTTGVKDHGSDGTLQWRLERLTDLKSWGNKNFGRWDTLKAQAAFTMMECKRDYHSLYTDLVAGTKSIETLTANFCNEFERPNPAAANIPHRIAAAKATRSLRAGTTLTPAPRKVGSAAAATSGAVAAGTVAAGHSLGFPWWVTAVVGVTALVIGLLIATKVMK